MSDSLSYFMNCYLCMNINGKFVKAKPKLVEMNEHFLVFVWYYFEEHVYATKPVVACCGGIKFYDCSSFIYQTDLNYVYQFEPFLWRSMGFFLGPSPTSSE